MTLRVKLFLSFFGLSTLIIIVGLVFYVQLKNLIEPLTPQSIPRGIEELDNAIERNDLINRLLYQQLLVQYDLENFVNSKQLSSLQDYHMNEEILSQLLIKTKRNNPIVWSNIEKPFQDLSVEQTQIVNLMLEGKFLDAKKLLLNKNYSDLTQKISRILFGYYQEFNVPSNERTVVGVKLTIKNTTEVLRNSMNTTLILFIAAMIISLILSFISASAISNPIKLLRNNMERMSGGDINIPISQRLLMLKGEIGDLARSFSSLISKLRTTTVLRDELILEIDRRKTFEEKLRHAAVTLQESNRELDQFAYAASHDLRAPLRAIESLTEWIEEDCYNILPEESRKNFDLLKKRVKRLEALIDGILEYSRAGKIDVSLESVDMKILLLEVIENLAPPAHIKIFIDENMPVINTNKIAMTQIFQNLISNAIKFNDKKEGIINIGYTVLGDFFLFNVADNGPGIPAQFHDKIFEIFQTLQARDTIESAGIGLATVKKIIEKSGGKIRLDSTLGQGTTFYFTWPNIQKT